MKRVTVNVDDELSAEAEAIADERDMSVSQFYAEAVANAVQEYKRQNALESIQEEIMGSGANVSREVFDDAHHEMRSDESTRA